MTKRKLIYYFLLLSSCLFTSCKDDESPIEKDTTEINGTRYHDSIFSNITVTTHTYDEDKNLELDIYSAEGDKELNRPLVLMAHGGAFVSGTKTSPLMTRLATKLAQRGYVAASIQYSLLKATAEAMDSNKLASKALEASTELQQAIRFMKKSVADGNDFGIDSNSIYLLGNSAGAFMALHVAFLDAEDELSPFIQDLVDRHKWFSPKAEFSQYSTKVAGIINMAGAIYSSTMIDERGVQVLSFHGTEDDIVPYSCGRVFSATSFPARLTVCGSAAIHHKLAETNLAHRLYSLPGKHTPWANLSTGQPTKEFDHVEETILHFLYDDVQ